MTVPVKLLSVEMNFVGDRDPQYGCTIIVRNPDTLLPQTISGLCPGDPLECPEYLADTEEYTLDDEP